MFFFGGARLQVPFDDGLRCVGAGHYGQTFRLFPVVSTDAQGFVAFPLNFGTAASQVVTGAETDFQLWFRDPMGPGGSGFNLSNGLAVRFSP